MTNTLLERIRVDALQWRVLTMSYVPKHHYTPEELDNAALTDLLRDADCAECQAHNGPYFPERGITKESLHAYAIKCLQQAEQYRNGGAHKAILNS